MPTRNRRHLSHALIAAVFALAASPAVALEDETDVTVNITIEPLAYLVFDSTPLLYLEIPPAKSTVPSNGVFFQVIGNAKATLTAEPDAFVNVPEGGLDDYKGKAILGPSVIGYKLELRFPRIGIVGSGVQISALPGYEEGPTQPAAPVDLTLTGGSRAGVLHMETNPDWTPDGSLPLQGIHVGQVVLTLSAEP